MAAWLGLRQEEAEAGAEARSWQYDSTWEEDDDEEEKEEEEEEEEEKEKEEAGDEDRLEDAEEPARGSGQAQGACYRAALKVEKIHWWSKNCRFFFLEELLDYDNNKKQGAFFSLHVDATTELNPPYLCSKENLIPNCQDQRSSNLLPLPQMGFQFSGRRNWNAARDLQRYRHRYPGLTESENEEEEQMWNLSFYKNEIVFLPQGLHIETLLELWWDNYEVLEENHSYIQWLFPLREHGMNWRAKPLTLQEIEAFKKSTEVMERFIRAYQLMLRFYGIILTNQETGELERAENWAERFQNLNRFSHNNLRITRILKCLGEMGYEHYQVHLVKFFLTETLVKETLPNVKRSALDYFLFTVRSKQKRRELVHYAWQHYKPQDSFVWGPHDKLSKYRPRSAKSQPHQTVGSKEEEPGRKCDDSVEKSQNPSLEEDQEVLIKANEEDTRERLSDSVSEGGDGEDEKEALFTQQEENDFSSKAEAQGTAENDCAKESKKRKLDTNVADDIKSGPLKSPPDIEKISRNLGECALDAEISPSSSLLQTEEGQETLKEDNVNAKDLTVPETADATVKRRKVDKRTQRNKTFNLAINLNMGLPARSAQLHPPVSNAEAEEEKAAEKKMTEEEVSKKDRGDTNGGVLSCPAASMLPKTSWTSPPSDGLELGAEQVTAKSDQHHCDSVLLGRKSEADGIEQHKKAANACEEEAKATSKKQVPGSLEQNMTSTCPEQDSAELAIQETDGSELHAAEPDEEQVAE